MKELKQYIQDVLDKNTTIKKWNPKGKLNLNLIASYEYYIVNTLNIDFLLMKPLYDQNISILKTQSSIIENKTGYKTGIILKNASNYKQQRLIQEKIPFIDINNQIYIPFIGLSLKKEQINNKNLNNIEKINRDKFTPMMQLVYLWILYNDDNVFTQELIEENIGISKMSISRSLDFFVETNILEYITKGKTKRKKEYFYENKSEFLKKGKKYLINPIKKVIYIDKLPSNIKVYTSGLSALSEQTMLSKPNNLIVAMTQDVLDYNNISIISKEIAMEKSVIEVQIMKYNIGVLTKDKYIDPITLIYSLEEIDDRIEIAIDELMEGYEWYKE